MNALPHCLPFSSVSVKSKAILVLSGMKRWRLGMGEWLTPDSSHKDNSKQY